MTSSQLTVAILGAAGLVGGVLRQGLKDDFEIRSFDRSGHRASAVHRLDARRLGPVTRALRGCDAVIDLASVARSDASPRDVYRTNLRVVSTVLQAAVDAHVPRVVFASSNHTMTGYEEQRPWADVLAGRLPQEGPDQLPRLPVDAVPRPRSAYGASKVYGESVCEWFAGTHGLSVTALRIGTVLQPDRPRNRRHLSTWLSHRDLVGLVTAALRCPDDELPRVVWGVSNNTWRIWNIEPSYNGYVRQDDAERYREAINTGT